MAAQEVCRVCHRRKDGGPSLVVGRKPLPCESCSPPNAPDDDYVRHGEWWCSGLCRALDIAAAEALQNHDRVLTLYGSGLVGERDLARSRYSLRLAFLKLDEAARPWGVGEERQAFQADIQSGFLVPPEEITADAAPVKRGSPEWRERISNGRRRRTAA